MGDNREVSRDSRNGLGYIEEDNIIGKVEFVYYPFSKMKMIDKWGMSKTPLIKVSLYFL